MSTVKHSAIERLARFGRDPFALLVVCIAGLGTAHILVRTATYGAAIQMGSVVFLSTATNFLAGEGWRHFTGYPLVAWPPLFPFLLAAGGWIGIEPVAAGRWINACAFGLTIFAVGCYLRSNLRSRWLALAATATIPALLPLSRWAAHLETAPIFVLLTLLALIFLASFLSRRTDAALWLAAVFTALAAITRYQGVALIGTCVLILLLTTRLKQTLIFGAVSSVPLLAVLVRNWAATGRLTRATGDRTPASGQPLSDGLRQTVEVFREWIVPPNAPDGVAYLLGLAAAAVVLASAAVILRAARQPDPEAAPAYLPLRPVLPFGVFAVVYCVFLITVMPLTVRLGVDSRYLLPIYVPLLLTAVFLLDRFLSIEAAGRMGAVRYLVAALVGLATLAHVGFSARENLRRTAKAWRAGYEKDWMYNTAYWQHSETMKYLRDNPIEGAIYSNNNELAWFAKRAADPGKHRRIPSEMRWPQMEAGAHIVWFDRFYNRAYISHDDTDLRVLSGVEVVAELADGTVFRRTAYEPFDLEKHRARKQRYVNQLIQQADEHIVRAGWNVYRTGRQLTYLKEPCAPEDVQAKFVLHLVPADPADLRADRKRHGSDNLDFYFEWRGEQVGDQCMAIIRLPAYPISRIHIGQWISAEDRTLWEAELSPSRPYWQQSESETLNYLRDNPIEGTIYSNYREPFWFADRPTPEKHRTIPHAMRWPQIEAGAHIVWSDLFYNPSFLGHDDTDLRLLPGVEVVAELADGVVLRRTAYEPFDLEKHRARKQRYVNQLIQQADEHIVRAGWSVYRTGRKLIYRKEPCGPADVQAKFVLHVVPTDPADLPARRQRHGSDNLDFYFERRGFYLGDQCAAIVRLPAYAMDRIQTGQWIAAENRTLWEAEWTPRR